MKLMLSRGGLESRRGWVLAARAIAGMRDASAAAGARFLVLFLPSKSQISLPLLQESVPGPRSSASCGSTCLKGRSTSRHWPANRLAQNALLREFCGRSGIPFVDASEALDAAMRNGVNVYFPDDSHLNETGQAIVAKTIQTFLR